ncbi:MAG: aspartate aminotransferase family protein [Burkholderiales bacterium]
MTASLLERRLRVLGRGAPLFYDEPLQVVSGEGVWLLGADGRRYLDAYNNVPILGHCHPEVVQAIARQAGQLNVHTRYLHEGVVAYSERLSASFNGLDRVVLTCSGSEANELALRMARLVTGRQGILCSNNTYHGNTEAVDELSTTFRQGRPGSDRVRALTYPDSYRPLGGLGGEALLEAHLAEVREAIAHFQHNGMGLAGLLICPVFANEGLPEPLPGYLEGVAHLVSQAGGLLILDEVQAGFARTGRLWGHQHAGIAPDIVTLGKPMGNGHPVAGLVSRADIVDDFRERVMYFNTFAGNPVSCAAATAVLDVIEREDLAGHAGRLGREVTEALRGLMSRHPAIGDVRGRGMFWAVELIRPEGDRLPDPERAHAVVNWMRHHGVLISRLGQHDNVLKIRPPLAFQPEHARLLIDTLDQALGQPFEPTV